MSFDPSDFNDVADLWASYQRGVQTQVMRDQARDLNEIKQHLRRQSDEQTRLDMLPKCPACMKPLELEAEKCAYCQEEVCWVEAFPFRKKIGDAKLNVLTQKVASALSVILEKRGLYLKESAIVYKKKIESFHRLVRLKTGDSSQDKIKKIIQSTTSFDEAVGVYKSPIYFVGCVCLGPSKMWSGWYWLAGFFWLLSLLSVNFAWICVLVCLLFGCGAYFLGLFSADKSQKAIEESVIASLGACVDAHNKISLFERQRMRFEGFLSGVLKHGSLLTEETKKSSDVLSGRFATSVSRFELPPLDTPLSLVVSQIDAVLSVLEFASDESGFWVKAGEVVEGAFTAAELVELGKAKKLKKAHFIGRSKDGPFEPVEKEWQEIVKLAKSKR